MSNRNHRKTWALLLIIAIIGVFLAVSISLQNMLMDAINILSIYPKAHPVLGRLLFTGLTALSVLISPFSSIPLVPSAIQVWGSVQTFLMIIIGWFMGACLAYGLGYFFGEKFLSRLFSFDSVRYYQNKFSERTQLWLVILFRLVLPSEVTSYTLGIIRYDFRRYLFATFITELPFAVLLVYSGNVLLNRNFLWFAVIILLIVLGLWLLYRYFHKKISGK